MRIIVRRARPSDAPAITSLLADRYKAELAARAERTGSAEIRTLDLPKLTLGVETVLRKGIAYVAEADSVIIGSIGGDGAYAGWYTNDVVFAELWFFVDPAYRKSRLAVSLLKVLKTAVRVMGFPYRSSVISGNDPDRLEKFYLRLGFKKLGAIVED